MAVSQASGFLFFTLLSICLAQESFSGRVSLSSYLKAQRGASSCWAGVRGA